MFDADTAPTRVAAETDAVVASFGLQPTRLNLFCMAAEMERRMHIYPGGPAAAAAVVRELRRRALAAL